jgi:plastocyanin
MTNSLINQRLAAAAFALVSMLACGGGEKPKTDTTAAAPSAAPPPSAAPGAPGAAPAPSTGATGTAQAITGKTWDVKMYADEKGSRYDPVSITIKRGDGIRWTLINGPPHNVAFWNDSIPAGAANVLQANMPNQLGALSGEMMTNPNQTYTISFAGVPAGTYHYYCVPHHALGMKGTIIVQ